VPLHLALYRACEVETPSILIDGSNREKEMNKIIKPISIVAITAFALVTIYDLLFNGWFEASSIDVDWWEAGAGSITFMIRFLLVAESLVLAVILVFMKQPVMTRVTWLGLILIIPLLFAYSARGIERYSESYDESVYQQITLESVEGKQHTKETVQSLLGTPLSKEWDDSIWSYTYMPSCGWGWTKRTFHFDDDGAVIGWDNYREP